MKTVDHSGDAKLGRLLRELLDSKPGVPVVIWSMSSEMGYRAGFGTRFPQPLFLVVEEPTAHAALRALRARLEE